MKIIILTIPHAGCFKATKNDQRRCDTRAYQAGMLIYNHLITSLDDRQYQVVVFPNTSVLREVCDLNRFDSCQLPNIKDEVEAFLSKVNREQIVLHLDVHSFPRATSKVQLSDTQHFYALMLPSSTAHDFLNVVSNYFNDRQRIIQAGGPLVTLAASDVNYFISIFSQQGIFSMLVEFQEEKEDYSDDALDLHAQLWAKFIIFMANYLNSKI